MATSPHDEPAWVSDPAVPLTDDERQHYMELIAPNAEAGNAMAILALRAMHGMGSWMELLVNYTTITDEGSRLALDTMGRVDRVAAAQFVAGAEWGFGLGQEGPYSEFTPEASVEAEAAWAARWGDVEQGMERDPLLIQQRRALLALAAHARMTVALAIILDRHSLDPADEQPAVDAALKVQPVADYEAGIAEQAIGLFLETLARERISLADEDDLLDAEDSRVREAMRAAAREVREGTEAALQLAADKHGQARRELLDGVLRGGGLDEDAAKDVLREYPGAVTLLPEPTVTDEEPS